MFDVRGPLALVLLAFFLTGTAFGQSGLITGGEPPSRGASESLAVTLGGNALLDLGVAKGKVSLTDGTVASVSSAGSGNLMVIGKKLGETTLIISNGSETYSWLIKVVLPALAIQDELQRLFPEQRIQARGVGGALVLTGEVSSAPMVDEAEQVAMGYLTGPSFVKLKVTPNVINLLRVPTRQQVMLEVKFAEVDRRSLRQVGVNFLGSYAFDGGRVGTALGPGALPAAGQAANLSELPVGNTAQVMPSTNNVAGGSIFLGLNDAIFPFSSTLNLLAQRSLAKTLAEPTLVAMSGQEASFLAGGEVPVVVAGSFGAQNVVFKPFGIELTFRPTVLADDTVQLRTNVAVSALDTSVSLNVNGAQTGGFKRRATSTTVRLRDGQSFAIAGLLQDEMQNLIQKVPGLGDIPILGVLFNSRDFQRRETELVVVVTIRLVDPMEPGRTNLLPGQGVVNDPSDVELFLLNLNEVRAPTNTRRTRGSSTNQRRRERSRRQPSGTLGFER